MMANIKLKKLLDQGSSESPDLGEMGVFVPGPLLSLSREGHFKEKDVRYIDVNHIRKTTAS